MSDKDEIKESLEEEVLDHENISFDHDGDDDSSNDDNTTTANQDIEQETEREDASLAAVDPIITPSSDTAAAEQDTAAAASGAEDVETAVPATTISVEPAAPQQITHEESRKPGANDSKFFAIRTTGGQERVVANLLQARVNAKKIGIRSILVLDSFKGYIIVEAPDSNVAYEALAGIRHVRGQIRGDLPFKDIEGYLVKKPVVSELNVDDTVEVIAGPFKSMKAKITRVDYEKQEATVVLLDSPYQIPVTVDANYLKKIAH